MTFNRMIIVSASVVAVMLAAGILTAAALPPGTRLPIHWGIDGQPDGYAGKWLAMLLPAGCTAVAALVMQALPTLEPRRRGLERSSGLYFWSWCAVLILGLAVQAALTLGAFGFDLSVMRLIAAALGLVLCLVGNQLGKSRSMYLIGIRTPWTLASEDVWVRTHRLAGKLLVVGGVILLVASAANASNDILVILLVATVTLGLLGPAGYSFFLWRNEKR